MITIDVSDLAAIPLSRLQSLKPLAKQTGNPPLPG
jgi:hypothetical protein